jgi:hypothetical protein
MPVTSQPIRSQTTPASTRIAPAGAGCAALIGVVLLLISVGPLIILLNGGYSILGMGYLCDRIGPYARLFWAVATAFTVDVPIAEKAGLPLAQPVLPWLMVGGITFLEVSLIWYRLKKADPGMWLSGAGLVVSGFDYITTAAGLIFAPFAADSGGLWYLWAILAVTIAAPLTFGFEGLLARALKGR